MKKHPQQPLVWDNHGVIRFLENKVVSLLLEEARKRGFNLNHLWEANLPVEDMEQFYQLIGMSVSGFGEVSSFDPENVEEYDRQVAKMVKEKGE